MPSLGIHSLKVLNGLIIGDLNDRKENETRNPEDGFYHVYDYFVI